LASNDLRGKFDKNQDGVLDFEEFAEWFLNTVNNLKRLQKVEAEGNSSNPCYFPASSLRKISFLMVIFQFNTFAFSPF
jgi:hypothetical protein